VLTTQVSVAVDQTVLLWVTTTVLPAPRAGLTMDELAQLLKAKRAADGRG
jgi:hypothetical protein